LIDLFSSRQLTTLGLISLLLGLGLTSQSALAGNKFDIATGYYSLTGQTRTASGTKSGIGSYRIGYRRSISPKVDVGLGYNITYSSIFGGDSAYGLDVGLSYFPFTASGTETFERNDQRLILQPDLRPFIGFAFTQRNIQSVQTGYAGFGVTLGLEKSWNENASLSGSLRYTTLSGSRSATATIMDVLLGIVWGF
jgi:hypothetical protein